MAMEISPAAQAVLDKIARPSERSKQRKIGPSEIGNPCERCLAERLLESARTCPPDIREESIASWIGTAGHAAIERLEIPGFSHEMKVTVGEIEGIGTITGSVDLYSWHDKQIIDLKFSSTKRINSIARAFTTLEDGTVLFDNDSPVVGTLQQYYVQQMLYGLGVENEGAPVESVSLLMIPRDATIANFETGVTELRFKFDKATADAMLVRAQEVLDWALAHPDDLDELQSYPHCYKCNRERTKLCI